MSESRASSEPLASAVAPSRLFLALAAVTWALIAFGALVRAKQAGLSCPDWPLCHGDVVPNLALKGVVYEFGHRVLAGLVTLTYVSGAVLLWRRGDLWQRVRRWVALGGALLVTQIVFGALTVLVVHHDDGASRPAAWTVATHLVLGNSFAAVALVLGLELRRLSRGTTPAPVPLSSTARVLAAGWTASLFTQFVLGGAIAGSLEGMVCTTFPGCYPGAFVPSWTGFIGLQVFHRLNALLLALWGGSLVLATWKAGRVGRVARLLGGLVVLQIVLGAVNIWSFLHAPVTTAHSAVAALLFSGTAVLWFEVAQIQSSWSAKPQAASLSAAA